MCIHIYIIYEAAFCKAIAQTLQRLSKRTGKSEGWRAVVLLAGGKSDIKRVPFKFWVFGGSLTWRYRVNYDYWHIFTSTWGTHEIYDWSDIFQIGISGHQQSSLDVLNILLETNPDACQDDHRHVQAAEPQCSDEAISDQRHVLLPSYIHYIVPIFDIWYTFWIL